MSATARNPALLCVYRAVQMSLFPVAVITLFWRREIGMGMTEIMLLQGVFGLAMALFEFPSGYLADRIGYRRSLLIAAGLMTLGWAVYSVGRDILEIAAAELILGVAMALISGSDSALLYESLKDDGREHEFVVWAGRVRFWGQIGEGTAAVAAGFLYVAWSRLPFALEVVIWLAGCAVAWRLVEPRRHRPPLGGNWGQVKAMLRHVARDAPYLRATMILITVLGMASFIPVWTIQIYATDSGVPEAWLGVVWAVANYVVAFGALVSHRLGRAAGFSRVLVLFVLLIALGYLGLGLSHGPWGFLFYYLLTLMRGLNGPVLEHEEHRFIPSRDRAGFVSLRSFFFRGLFLVLGPLVGWLIDRHGQHPVLLGLGAGLCVAAVAAALAVTATRRATASAAEPEAPPSRDSASPGSSDG